MLCEGNSIRSVERMTGIHRDTIMRLGLNTGNACRNLMDETMRELPCAKIEVDEIWGYIGKKQRNVTEADDASKGDVWTFVAIDPDSKAVPVFHVGKRSANDTNKFIDQVAARTKNRIQLSSDGLKFYETAVEAAFGAEVDFGTREAAESAKDARIFFQRLQCLADEVNPSGKVGGRWQLFYTSIGQWKAYEYSSFHIGFMLETHNAAAKAAEIFNRDGIKPPTIAS